MRAHEHRSLTAPEILAPAGGWAQARAAVENGADAIYFGTQDFNARARAANFSMEELPELMAMLHERGVQGFVTFNTLVFDEEMSRAERVLRGIVEAGVDALIVQDLGVVRLIREISADVPIHGSTQMTITSAQGAELVGAMGVERVVLGRELSAAEVATIAAQTDIELEVFVHGALCVSYSGQCFSSEAWGGRSANRGQCAQACRLPYDMFVDGERRDLGDKSYLLSPQDLMGVGQVAALMAAGVSCFKIEGRLKGPEYVAMTTRTYREAVDRVMAGGNADLSVEQRQALETIFSRGLTPGFLDGVKHQRLVDGRSPRHRGLRLGDVHQVTGQGVKLKLDAPVKRGDGIVFDAAQPQEREEGGKVYEIFWRGRSVTDAREGQRVELRFGPGVRLDRIEPGHIVWKNRDEALEAAERATFEQGVQRREPVDAVISGAQGAPLRLTLRDDQGREVTRETDAALVPARNRGLDAKQLRKFVGRLGDTPLELRELNAMLEGALFMPTSQLNAVRREAAEALIAARRRAPARHLRDGEALPGLLGRLSQLTATSADPAWRAARDGALEEGVAEEAAATPTANTAPGPAAALGARAAVAGRPTLSLLCRTPEQIEAALAVDDVETVYVDFLEIKGLADAVKRVQQAGRRAVACAPRILKVKEERIWRFLLRTGADGILVRSLGLLHTLTSLTDEAVPPLYGDFSLNAANALSVDHLRGFGLARVTPGHDLNAAQLCALAEQVGGDDLELIIHHHLPVFHTEHCVFCRFLSDGNDYRDCGRPCEEHTVKLRDTRGLDHIVLADMGCRNTVFNAVPQSGGQDLSAFMASGYRHFRIELVDHAPDDVAPLVSRYREALDGRLDAPALWKWLSTERAEGVTLGSLVVKHRRRALKPTAR